MARRRDRQGRLRPRSAYAETFWLPVLGPSTTWLLRHFTIQLERSPEGVELDVEDTARSLGLGERLNPNGPFVTLKRCVDFEMARWRGPQPPVVRTELPPLPADMSGDCQRPSRLVTRVPR